MYSAYICIAVGYYDLSALSMSVMGFQKNIWMEQAWMEGGWVG